MCFGLQRFWSLSRRFMRFHNTTIHFLNSFSSPIFGFAPVFTMVGCLLHGIAVAIGLHNFLLCVFENFWIFSIFRIDDVNASQSSSIIELWLLGCPFLLFSLLSGFTNFGPNFWPYMIWSGSRLNLCQSRPRPHISFWKSSVRSVNFVNPLQESDKCLLESTFH